MTFLQGFKDFVGGLVRGFGLFFTERNDFVTTAHIPGVKLVKHS